MLTGDKIEELRYKGDLEIEPFNKDNLNPNSYNLTLGNKLLVYNKQKELEFNKNLYGDDADAISAYALDPRNIDTLSTTEIIIPETGYILKPGTLYLGTTIERTKTDKYIPCISGRSSIGRLGINIHATAGFGDIGFDGKWTLEIFTICPVKIYPNTKIAQIYYFEPNGSTIMKYHGKYQGQYDVTASRLYLDR